MSAFDAYEAARALADLDAATEADRLAGAHRFPGEADDGASSSPSPADGASSDEDAAAAAPRDATAEREAKRKEARNAHKVRITTSGEYWANMDVDEFEGHKLKAYEEDDNDEKLQTAKQWSMLAREMLVAAAEKVRPITGCESEKAEHNHWIAVAAQHSELMKLKLGHGAGAGAGAVPSVDFRERSAKACYEKWGAAESWRAPDVVTGNPRHNPPANQRKYDLWVRYHAVRADIESCVGGKGGGYDETRHGRSAGGAGAARAGPRASSSGCSEAASACRGPSKSPPRGRRRSASGSRRSAQGRGRRGARAQRPASYARYRGIGSTLKCRAPIAADCRAACKEGGSRAPLAGSSLPSADSPASVQGRDGR